MAATGNRASYDLQAWQSKIDTLGFVCSDLHFRHSSPWHVSSAEGFVTISVDGVINGLPQQVRKKCKITWHADGTAYIMNRNRRLVRFKEGDIQFS